MYAAPHAAAHPVACMCPKPSANMRRSRAVHRPEDASAETPWLNVFESTWRRPQRRVVLVLPPLRPQPKLSLIALQGRVGTVTLLTVLGSGSCHRQPSPVMYWGAHACLLGYENISRNWNFGSAGLQLRVNGTGGNPPQTVPTNLASR
jgi:hypothetical protein